MAFSDKEIFDITVTAASGVESVTKKELERLSYGQVPAINGSLTFKGGFEDVARCNMFLRTADRVYIRAAEFTAVTFDELFDGVSSIRWEDYISIHGKIVVDGKCVKSTIFGVSACQKIVKKAIVVRLCKAYKCVSLDETGEEYKIDFAFFKNTVSILINTSGNGLHKRGYRDYVGMAPIKENLAAAMLLLSDFYYKKPLVDPFCGSGTFIIEGAKIALDIASGIQRDFDYVHWKFFPTSAYANAFAQAKDGEKLDRELDFCGYDIDPKAVKLANRHAFNARLSDKIKFAVADVKDFSSNKKQGIIVTNPPYGKRLSDEKEVISLYRTFGEVCAQLDNWSVFLITPCEEFERAFGKKADRTRKLYNSNQECRYYQYFQKREKENTLS